MNYLNLTEHVVAVLHLELGNRAMITDELIVWHSMCAVKKELPLLHKFRFVSFRFCLLLFLVLLSYCCLDVAHDPFKRNHICLTQTFHQCLLILMISHIWGTPKDFLNNLLFAKIIVIIIVIVIVIVIIIVIIIIIVIVIVITIVIIMIMIMIIIIIITTYYYYLLLLLLFMYLFIYSFIYDCDSDHYYHY